MGRTVKSIIDSLDSDVLWKINDRCGKCRYCYRSVFSEPCKTGMHFLCYSGTCAAYRPSLKTIVTDLIRKLRGAKDGKTD